MNMGQGDVNEMSMQVSFRMMNDTMKDCFSTCVTDFRSGELNSSEQTCLKNCATRSFAALTLLGQMQEQMQSKSGMGRF